MKPNKPRQMDEREKLRKFRELDDAFAQALRDMEGVSQRQQQAQQQDAHQEFERRLRALMHDFRQSDTSVDTLLRTLVELGKIA
ncbi:hypothetical protein [Modicisalibacter ilicicola]|nr:hypothetical protein [Halomonas ilicicola]